MKPGNQLFGTAAPGLRARVWSITLLLAMVYAFLVSLELMSGSFRLMGEPFARNLVASAGNPFVGLFIGMLVTALLQSSSVTTSAVVVMVASGAFGPVSDPAAIALAVPLIMGANIGTTITSTIVALGHITVRREYRKAVAAAALHNVFNIITVLVLFPLEMSMGILSRPASALASWLATAGPGDHGLLWGLRFVRYAIEPVADAILRLGNFVFGGHGIAGPIVLIVVALAILFLTLNRISHYLREMLTGRHQKRLEILVFGNPLKALGWGTVITAIVQSSSATTSLTVPLVATGKVSLRKCFPFIVGANIGTTSTALIAAMLVSGNQLVAGLAIAICHVLFNVFGMLVLLPVSQIRMVPIHLARKVGGWTMRNRVFGVGYIAVTFFLIPFLLILLANPPRRFQERTMPRAETKKEAHDAPRLIPPQDQLK